MVRTEWSGVLKTNGGTFEELCVDGVVTCNGSVEAQKIDLNGTLTMNGAVRASENLVVEGVVTIRGDVQTACADLNGTLNVRGDVNVADALDVGGVVTIHGNARAKKITLDSVCTVMGNLEADHIECEGVMSCKKQISADLVECQGALSAAEIVGEKVILRCEKRGGFFFSRKKLSEIGLIEATEVEIDGVQCQNVNGHNITIGPNCEIDHVDCTGILKIAPEAKVGKIN